MTRKTLLAATLALAAAQPAGALAATLTGRAVLPAETFAQGPVSGTLIGPGPFNGVTPPFTQGQPVQGFSGALDRADGTFYAMADNGYGAKANSGDFNLRVYTVRPGLRTAGAGTGDVKVEGHFELTDPASRAGFPIRNAGTARRVLTGADFDIESIQRAPDGTFWLGEEFGPFLLHVSADGRLLERPVPTPGVASDSNPFIAPGTGNLPNSKGFEGMAASPDGRYLYPMLEGALKTDPDPRTTLRIYEFDTQARGYTGRVWKYAMESPGNALGDLQAVNDHEMLIIERDGGQGPAAAFKKIYKLDLDSVGPDGFVAKTEVADLMALADPAGISTSLPAPRPGDIGLGATFTFPFVTIEDIVILSRDELLVLNDNNFPFSAGRNAGRPDDNEMIRIRLDAPLAVDPDVLVTPALATAREHLLAAGRAAAHEEGDDAEAAGGDALKLIAAARDRLAATSPRDAGRRRGHLRAAEALTQRGLEADADGDFEDAEEAFAAARRQVRRAYGDGGPRRAERRSFALIGDYPYTAAEVGASERMVADVNADRSVEVVLHDGDTKGGSTPCDDGFYPTALARFSTIMKPVVYSPGDNEWTDCHRAGAGSFVPSERLALLRRTFFARGAASPTLGGGAAFTPRRQSDAYPENARFRRAGVTFATVHVTGSNNNLVPAGDTRAQRFKDDAAAEFPGRDAANVAWLRDTFRAAREDGSRGVMIVMQANPGWGLFPGDPAPTGFTAFLAELERQAKAFRRPVAVVHGDTHVQRIDHPLPGAPNVVRVETFGSPNTHWVKATVDPASPHVFTFAPRLVTGNALTPNNP